MSLLTQRRVDALLAGIDHGLQAHLAWNQRLMRCALLRESPGDGMLQSDAHQCCDFGKWLQAEEPVLAAFDGGMTEALERHHRAMHEAVRRLCTHALQGLPADEADLRAYESGQRGMVACLNALRARVAASVQQNDALTGLPLRKGLDYAFGLRQRDAARNEQPLYLAMVDVDHFKRVNDTWGHAVGDQALQHLARIMTSCLRENDIVIRYGGEEFVFLLMGAGGDVVVGRLLDEVRSHPMRMEGGQLLRMTVTAGLTAVTAADTLESAVDRADRAMLQGKTRGRDRFVLA